MFRQNQVQPISQALQHLLGANSTLPQSGEAEPWILEPEEEDRALFNAAKREREQAIWKLQESGFRPSQEMENRPYHYWISKICCLPILQIANSNKIADQWHKNNRKEELKKIAEKREQLEKQCNAKWFINYMKEMAWTKKNKKLIINKQTEHLITAVCFFLSKDERFETDLGYDLSKGLLFWGQPGMGKTFIPSLVKNNPVNAIRIISMKTIASEVQTEGEYNIDMMDCNILYLDDVGAEQTPVNYFGTFINWFKNYIEDYELNNKKFNRLFISTNLTPDEIENRYGGRVRDRFRDMFNVIALDGTSFRGNNF